MTQSERVIVQISQHDGSWRDLYLGEFISHEDGREWVDGLDRDEATKMVKHMNARPKWLSGAKFRVVGLF